MGNKIGVIAGAFDVIHPGYILAFKEAKQYCDWLVVCLHEDPSIENPKKLKPILPVLDRMMILESIHFVDEVMIYKTESDFLKILQFLDPGVRFLGSDYEIGIPAITGRELNIPIHFINREHGWSATKFKEMICQSLAGR